MLWVWLRGNSEWDGLVRELLEQRADLAVADLTITFDREQVIQAQREYTNIHMKTK